MSLKNNLVKYMKLRGITIRELALETDISEPTLKRLRTIDNTNPTLDVLIKLSKTLGVKINDLIGEQDTLKEYRLGSDTINPDDTQEEFIVIFQSDIFGFKAGTRALFKRYTPEVSTLTKYVIRENSEILKLADAEEFLFMDEKNKIFSLDEKKISAYIVKQLYEVNYV